MNNIDKSNELTLIVRSRLSLRQHLLNQLDDNDSEMLKAYTQIQTEYPELLRKLNCNSEIQEMISYIEAIASEHQQLMVEQ